MVPRQTFRDVLPVLSAALERGIAVVEFESAAAAIAFTHRAHRYRAAERRENSKIYKPGEPLYNTSVYDQLKIAPRDRFVHVERREYIMPISMVDGDGKPIDIQEYIDVQRMIDGGSPIGPGDPAADLDAIDDARDPKD